MDKRRLALQLRAIRVTLRVEELRHDAATLEGFRSRAREMLDGLEEVTRPYSDLEEELAEARRELAAKTL